MSTVRITVTAAWPSKSRSLTVADVVGSAVDAKRLFEWLDGRLVCDREGKPTEVTLHVEAKQEEPGVWMPLDLTEDP